MICSVRNPLILIRSYGIRTRVTALRVQEPHCRGRGRSALSFDRGHWKPIQPRANLVSVTRFTKSKTSSQSRKAHVAEGHAGYWILQDAKARFSELVRRVRSEGPQHVTVHGREEVVVIAAEEFRRLKGGVTGRSLIDAMQASPYRDVDIEPRRDRLPVRDVVL